LVKNKRVSRAEVSEFVTHLKMRPSMKFGVSVLGFLHERAVLGTWKFVLDVISKLRPSLQTALMATDEPYSELVQRNRAWIGLLQTAKTASGVSKISAVHDITALKGLTAAQSAAWANQLTSQECLAGDVIIRQSSIARDFFAIRAGTCTVSKDGDVIIELGPGDSFGDVALLLGVPSPITVKAASDCTLLRMDGDGFLRMVDRCGEEVRSTFLEQAANNGICSRSVANRQDEGRRRARSLIEEQGLVPGASSSGGSDCSECSELDIDEALGTAGVEVYVAGEVLTLDSQHDRLRLVEDGTCSVMRVGREVRELQPGDLFGPDLAKGEHVVAKSARVHICSFAPDTSSRMLACLRGRPQ